VEEKGIVALGASNQPLHGANDVSLIRQVHFRGVFISID
jgi:hypothetical protein